MVPQELLVRGEGPSIFPSAPPLSKVRSNREELQQRKWRKERERRGGVPAGGREGAFLYSLSLSLPLQPNSENTGGGGGQRGRGREEGNDQVFPEYK